MLDQQERNELVSWRRNRVPIFWAALVLFAIGLLALAATGAAVAQVIVTGSIYIIAVVAFLAPLAFVIVAGLWGFMSAIGRIWGRLPTFKPKTVAGLIFVLFGALLLVVPDAPFSISGNLSPVLLGVGVVVLGSGFVTVRGSLSIKRILEGGVILNGRTYLPFSQIHRAFILVDGLIEEELTPIGPPMALPDSLVRRHGRVLVAFDLEGRLALKHALADRGGPEIEAAFAATYFCWSQHASQSLPCAEWLHRGGNSLPVWLGRLRDHVRLMPERSAYRSTPLAAEHLFALLRKPSLAPEVRAGAAFVLLQHLPPEKHSLVFECVGADSPPLLSAVAWFGAKPSTRRRTRPYGEACLSPADQRAIQREKRRAWLDLLGTNRMPAGRRPLAMR